MFLLFGEAKVGYLAVQCRLSKYGWRICFRMHQSVSSHTQIEVRTTHSANFHQDVDNVFLVKLRIGSKEGLKIKKALLFQLVLE
jgi:hypothetical protein